MNALWEFVWDRSLAESSGYGLCVVPCAAIIVAIAFVKEIGATKPSIEWNTKNGSIRVKFPHRAVRK